MIEPTFNKLKFVVRYIKKKKNKSYSDKTQWCSDSAIHCALMQRVMSKAWVVTLGLYLLLQPTPNHINGLTFELSLVVWGGT